MKEERIQILKMIQEGIISAEEGTKLLAALRERSTRTAPRPPKASPAPPVAETPVREKGYSPRWVRIRMMDKNSDRDRLNVTLPMGLLDWGLKWAELTAGVNLTAVRDVILGGAQGRIIAVEDSNTGERIEIFTE